MALPVTVWDSQRDDDDPIAYVYDAAGTIQQRIYRQHAGAEVGRRIVWFCTCPKGDMWPLQRCDHLLRFMTEATAGRLGPGIMLTHYGRRVADESCQCNTGRRLEESPLPPRPVGDGLNAKERRAAKRAEAAARYQAELDRLAQAQQEAEARAAAERKRREELEVQWRAAFDARTAKAQARIAAIEAEATAVEKARAKRKRSKPKAKAPVKKAKKRGKK